MEKQRYKRFFEKHIANYRERKIFDTHHSIERFNDENRFDDAGKEEFRNKLFKVLAHGIKKILSEHNDYSSSYLIHSKSTGIGVVIDWRKDKFNRVDYTNHAFIVTILPIKKHHTKKDEDILLVVEKQLTEWALKRLEERKEKLILSENAYDRISTEDKEFSVIFWEGKYYDATIYKTIIVE